MSASNAVEYVEVQLELGHHAEPRPKATTDGYTHDWHVFVRGPSDCKIQHFIEKVVFVLHESFPKPRRVMKEPPYSVSASGYASFELPIEVYFKNKEEPKKITFEYDLFLNMEDSVSNTRREKLTFQNPSPEFKKKLLKAGGVCHEKASSSSTPTHSEQEHQQRPPSSSGSQLKSAKSGHVPPNDCNKKSKFATIASKDIKDSQGKAKEDMHEKQQQSAGSQSQFNDLFGAPLPTIQARPSPSHMQFDTTRSKETSKSISGSVKNSNSSTRQPSSQSFGLSLNDRDKKTKHKSLKESDRSGSSDRKESSSKSSSSKSAFDDRVRFSNDNISSSHKKTSSPALSIGKSDSNDKSQRPAKETFGGSGKSSSSGGSSNSKKRRRSNSSESPHLGDYSNGSGVAGEGKKDKDGAGGKSSSSVPKEDYKKDSKKFKPKEKESTPTIASSGGGGSNSSHKVKDVKKESSTSTTISFSNNNSTGTTTLEIKSVKKEKTWDKESKKFKNKESKGDESLLKGGATKSTESDAKNFSNPTNSGTCGSKGKEESSKTAKPVGSKYKVPKEKSSSSSRHRDVSSSPASIVSGSLTPGGLNGVNGSTGSLHERVPMNSVDDERVSFSSPADSSPSLVGYEVATTGRRGRGGKNSSDDESDHSFSGSGIYRGSHAVKPGREATSAGGKRRPETTRENDKLSTDVQSDKLDLKELMSLQSKICQLKDRNVLQLIVDEIESSDAYNVTESTFDFDLMKLDRATITRLKKLVK